MIKKFVGLATFFAFVLGPETLCNMLHIGEYPDPDEPQVVVEEIMEVAAPIVATSKLSEKETVANPSPLTDEEWATLVGVCSDNNIPVDIALGLIWVESRFQPDAVSPHGCYGYCQLNPRYFPDKLSPAYNIRAGMKYLGDCLTRYDGDISAALTAYHDGRDTGRRGYANAVLEAAKNWGLLANNVGN